MLMKLYDIAFDVTPTEESRPVAVIRYAKYQMQESTTCKPLKQYSHVYTNQNGQTWQYEFIMRRV
jgi:hypothetical protein